MTSVKTKVQYLLLDIGDVLLLKDSGQSFTNLLATELNIALDLAQKVNEAHFTTMDAKFIPQEVFITELKKSLDYDAPQDIYAYFARAYNKQVRPNTELLDFLLEVRAMGIKTAVLSNTIAIYQQIQEQSGISKQNGFDPIVYSWEVELLKPDTAIFELALLKLNAKSEEVIFIDDKIGHLEGAQKLGIKTILFENTKDAIADIKEAIA